MENWLPLIFWLVVIGVYICFKLAKKGGNRKAAESGEDKARVREAVEPFLDGNGNYQLIYAHWEEQESYARMVKTTYHRYAVACQNQTLYVFPLYIDKRSRQIQAGQPGIFAPEHLGKVTVKTRQKDGAAEHMKIWLADKQGKELCQLYVDAENLRKNKWYPVNISQREECAALERFMASLAQRVAAENPGVDDLIKADNAAGTGFLGACISILGVVFTFFFPPVGVVFALIGLIMTVVSKLKGAKGLKPLIISIICMLCSGGFSLWAFLVIYAV